MRAAGADDVLDYMQGHYSESGGRFDLILDVAAYGSLGDFRSVVRSKRALTPNGRYALYLAGGGVAGRVFTTVLLQGWLKVRGGTKLSIHYGAPNRPEDVARVTEMVDSGAV